MTAQPTYRQREHVVEARRRQRALPIGGRRRCGMQLSTDYTVSPDEAAIVVVSHIVQLEAVWTVFAREADRRSVIWKRNNVGEPKNKRTNNVSRRHNAGNAQSAVDETFLVAGRAQFSFICNYVYIIAVLVCRRWLNDDPFCVSFT